MIDKVYEGECLLYYIVALWGGKEGIFIVQFSMEVEFQKGLDNGGNI